MKRQLTLALSLFVLGALPVTALADSGRTHFRLLGTTWCFKDAPQRVDCDIRFPMNAPPEASTTRERAQAVRILGLDVCSAGAPVTTECDVRLPTVPPTSNERHASL